VVDTQACQCAVCRIKKKCVQLGESGTIIELIGVVQYLKPGDGRIEIAVPRSTAISCMYDEAETPLRKTFL
jgi:hypothetical protein